MTETEEKILKFFSQYKLLEYRKKEVIIHQSDDPTGVYFVKEGFVKMNLILSNGNELTLNIFKANSFFPMTWALADILNNYQYQAIGKVILFKAPKKEFEYFIKENPEILFDLTKRILTGLDGLLTNISNLLVGSAESRVLSAFVILAKRFGEKDRERINLNIRLTHQDIADICGLTRETTSAVISKLQKKGLISQKKGNINISSSLSSANPSLGLI